MYSKRTKPMKVSGGTPTILSNSKVTRLLRERRVIVLTLLKYSLNQVNLRIWAGNIYLSESDLQSLLLDCGNKVHHEE